jgi:cysteine desulfurase
MTRVYLDHNATTPLRPEARGAMLAAMDILGNPSSVHAEGRAAKALIERARAQVAAAVGCNPAEVIFTSGATEAATVLAAIPGGVSVDPTAHDAVWAQRRDGDPAVHAMGLANGETGVLSDPVTGGPRLLLDVTQAIGRIPFAFGWSGADFAVLSAHKFGGPKGVGALILRDGVADLALQPGGGQEMGRRSGTENLIGIAGFGAAIDAALRDLAEGVWDRVAQLRNILEEAVAAASPGTIFCGQGSARLPNTSCFATPGWKGETQVMAMDLAGFAISAGSACSSGKVRESRVLRAMGYAPEVATSAIRVSLGPDTTEDHVLRFAQSWSEKLKRLHARAA